MSIPHFQGMGRLEDGVIGDFTARYDLAFEQSRVIENRNN